MLSVVVFGAVCELDDEDPYARNVPTVYFNSSPAPKRAEAPDLNTTQTHRRRFRGRSEWVDATLGQTQRWQLRWLAYRERRRENVSVRFTEFVELSDGRRVIIRNDRGWSQTPGPWDGITRESLTDYVRNYLRVEEEECCPVSPELVVEYLRRSYDLEVEAASVEAALQLPRLVEFGTHLLQQLSRDEPLAKPSSSPANDYWEMRKVWGRHEPPAEPSSGPATPG